MKKKLLCTILSFALCIGIAVPSLAAGETLTIETLHISGSTPSDGYIVTFSISGVVDQTVDNYNTFFEGGDTVEVTRHTLYVEEDSELTLLNLDHPVWGNDGDMDYISGYVFQLNDAEENLWENYAGYWLYMGASWKNYFAELEEWVEQGKEFALQIGDYFIRLSNDTSTQPQADAPSTWAAGEVTAAIAAGLVPDVLQRNYKSDVSRGAVAQMFINLIEQTAGMTISEFMAAKGVSSSGNPFTDTTDSAVLAANALGIINGVGNYRFDPGGTLTRAQIAAIINRVARVMGVDSEGYAHSFSDVTGHWVDEELGWPVHAGIITGYEDGTFRPNGNLTTEQAIAITYRALEALKA